MLSIDLQLSSQLFELGKYLPKSLVVLFASYFIWVMIVYIIFFARRAANHMRTLVYIFIAGGVAYFINQVIGYFFFRERPFITEDVVALINTSHLDKSFPSDHSGVAWAFATFVFLIDKKSGALLMVLALFISLGRVSAGVHYLSDVFGGAIVGVVAAIFVYSIKKKKSI